MMEGHDVSALGMFFNSIWIAQKICKLFTIQLLILFNLTN